MSNAIYFGTLDELCNVEYGTRVVNKRDGGIIYPVYGGGGATFKMDSFNRESCMVVARFAMSEQCTRFVKGRFFLNDSGLTLSSKNDDLSMSYLNYQILSLNDDIYSIARGAAQKNLNVKEFKKLKISVAPLEEQKRIVALLDTVFADLEQTRAKTEQNLKNARELFDSYLQQVFSQKGDGWERIPLGEVADLVDSLHTTPKYIDEGGFPMVRVTEIKKSGLNLKKAKRVDQETYEKFSKRHKSCVGDIILSRVGASYGIPVIVETNEFFCLGQNTVFILPKINAYWLYYFLLSPAAKEQIDGFVAGSAQPTVSMKSIRQLIVPIPSKLEQDRIEPEIKKVLSESNKLIEIYQKKLSSIAELKKSILQKVFSGELTTNKNIGLS